jgi:hypothetical protein
MKEFITKLAQENMKEVKVNLLLTWIESFDVKNMSKDVIDQLIALAENAEDKSKIALIDLLRLIVLDES